MATRNDTRAIQAEPTQSPPPRSRTISAASTVPSFNPKTVAALEANRVR